MIFLEKKQKLVTITKIVVIMTEQKLMKIKNINKCGIWTHVLALVAPWANSSPPIEIIHVFKMKCDKEKYGNKKEDKI
jgi:hypothetical protein